MKRLLQICSLLTASLFVAAAQSLPQPASAPEQPLPFSHKMHAGELQLKCATCHLNSDPGEKMGFPAPSICMECHSVIVSERPAIEKLAQFARENREIKWVRVYQIPSYVFFSHRAHLAAGSTCVECHGQVKDRERLYREGDISMAGCIKCHQAKQASIDCTYCHDKLN